MDQSTSRKRPWLAAGLGLLVTGLGQLYLRRWKRALGWAVFAVLVGAFLVPESTLANPASADLVDGAPLLVVGVLSVVDAYLIARRHNVRLAVAQESRCPSCYRELDADVAFCPWCGSEVQSTAAADGSARTDLDTSPDDRF
ncbi:zinc ribbon domain-containing protein [Natrialba asiatica]|uniref:DUF7575 domain-containing protein n=1 Tax=Natrialba asiatica (strain ATCC 700177 / DSM 12278 / JCM 9576 / FERM P-10747 / NBRC 102637 / 172P1) TaxID=29540 RepID=M0B409_NATA1|nr:zinc ribbon domain-containing protein [Natrialba asiatica]ELZ05520.1 hypothetical protein C481_02337 [Natrialba asiatica DSM 12278]